MAQVTVKKCDVFGTYKDVCSVTVTVERSLPNPNPAAIDPVFTMDACPKAYARLIRFIERGVKPPTGRPQEPILGLNPIENQPG